MTKFREERIEKLLRELEYEIVRGMMENEISEHLTFEFIVPISRELKNGVVSCRFTARPTLQYSIRDSVTKLRIIK